MAKTSKNDRKPAEVVKCPYCDHTGSARGLFSHVRLAHQGKNVNTRKEWLKNPYAVAKKPTLSEKMEIIRNRPKFRTTEEFFLELLIEVGNNLIAQTNRKGKIGYIPTKNP